MSVVLAPACAACARPLEDPLRSAVCDRCWNGIRVLQPPFCGVCGDPLLAWRPVDDGYRCEPCRVRRPHITAGRAIGDYDGPLRAIVHALKYDGRRSLARPLGGLLRRHAGPILSGADLAVPVPLHWSRQWRRGFNQARELAVGLGLPVLYCPETPAAHTVANGPVGRGTARQCPRRLRAFERCWTVRRPLHCPRGRREYDRSDAGGLCSGVEGGRSAGSANAYSSPSRDRTVSNTAPVTSAFARSAGINAQLGSDDCDR